MNADDHMKEARKQWRAGACYLTRTALLYNRTDATEGYAIWFGDVRIGHWNHRQSAADEASKLKEAITGLRTDRLDKLMTGADL